MNLENFHGKCILNWGGQEDNFGRLLRLPLKLSNLRDHPNKKSPSAQNCKINI